MVLHNVSYSMYHVPVSTIYCCTYTCNVQQYRICGIVYVYTEYIHIYLYVICDIYMIYIQCKTDYIQYVIYDIWYRPYNMSHLIYHIYNIWCTTFDILHTIGPTHTHTCGMYGVRVCVQLLHGRWVRHPRRVRLPVASENKLCFGWCVILFPGHSCRYFFHRIS